MVTAQQVDNMGVLIVLGIVIGTLSFAAVCLAMVQFKEYLVICNTEDSGDNW